METTQHAQTALLDRHYQQRSDEAGYDIAGEHGRKVGPEDKPRNQQQEETLEQAQAAQTEIPQEVETGEERKRAREEEKTTQRAKAMDDVTLLPAGAGLSLRITGEMSKLPPSLMEKIKQLAPHQIKNHIHMLADAAHTDAKNGSGGAGRILAEEQGNIGGPLRMAQAGQARLKLEAGQITSAMAYADLLRLLNEMNDVVFTEVVKELQAKGYPLTESGGELTLLLQGEVPAEALAITRADVAEAVIDPMAKSVEWLEREAATEVAPQDRGAVLALEEALAKEFSETRLPALETVPDGEYVVKQSGETLHALWVEVKDHAVVAMRFDEGALVDVPEGVLRLEKATQEEVEASKEAGLLYSGGVLVEKTPVERDAVKSVAEEEVKNVPLEEAEEQELEEVNSLLAEEGLELEPEVPPVTPEAEAKAVAAAKASAKPARSYTMKDHKTGAVMTGLAVAGDIHTLAHALMASPPDVMGIVAGIDRLFKHASAFEEHATALKAHAEKKTETVKAKKGKKPGEDEVVEGADAVADASEEIPVDQPDQGEAVAVAGEGKPEPAVVESETGAAVPPAESVAQEVIPQTPVADKAVSTDTVVVAEEKPAGVVKEEAPIAEVVTEVPAPKVKEQTPSFNAGKISAHEYFETFDKNALDTGKLGIDPEILMGGEEHGSRLFTVMAQNSEGVWREQPDIYLEVLNQVDVALEGKREGTLSVLVHSRETIKMDEPGEEGIRLGREIQKGDAEWNKLRDTRNTRTGKDFSEKKLGEIAFAEDDEGIKEPEETAGKENNDQEPQKRTKAQRQGIWKVLQGFGCEEQDIDTLNGLMKAAAQVKQGGILGWVMAAQTLGKVMGDRNKSAEIIDACNEAAESKGTAKEGAGLEAGGAGSEGGDARKLTVTNHKTVQKIDKNVAIAESKEIVQHKETRKETKTVSSVPQPGGAAGQEKPKVDAKPKGSKSYTKTVTKALKAMAEKAKKIMDPDGDGVPGVTVKPKPLSRGSKPGGVISKRSSGHEDEHGKEDEQGAHVDNDKPVAHMGEEKLQEALGAGKAIKGAGGKGSTGQQAEEAKKAATIKKANAHSNTLG